MKSMKKGLMVLLILLTIVFAIDIHAGDYQSQKIISTSWGQQDGEFGLIMEAEGNCPQSITVDNEGNLAILDLVNKRIQRYSPDGEWLGKFKFTSQAFDTHVMKGSYILLAPYDYLIEQYNQEGKLIEKLNVNRKIEFIDGLRMSGNDIFVQTVEQTQYNISKKTQAKQLESVQQGLSAQRGDGICYTVS